MLPIQSRRGHPRTTQDISTTAAQTCLPGYGSVILELLMLMALSLCWSLQHKCPEPCDCQHLHHILCSNRGLHAVPKFIPPSSNPSGTKTYSLGGNFISNISASDFLHFPNLQRLDLQYNGIQFIHPKALEKLDHLEELYLGNNLLPGIVPGALSHLKKLKVLNVNGNQLHSISRASFSNLLSLIKLRLDHNVIHNLQGSPFSALSNLLYLHLENNKIGNISKNAFSGLGKLRLLSMSGNAQNSLRHSTFLHLRSLGTLIMARNQLQQLGPGVFHGLQKLSKLVLSLNQLYLLHSKTFVGLEVLQELHLDGNLLKELPEDLLVPMHNLEILNLSHNALSNLHPGTFSGVSRLRVLDLQHNTLRFLSGESFTGNPVLYRLQLDGNRWNCDCHLLGLKHWILGILQARSRMLTVFVQCWEPDAVTGKYLDYLEDSYLQGVGICDLHTTPAGQDQGLFSTLRTKDGALQPYPGPEKRLSTPQKPTTESMKLLHSKHLDDLVAASHAPTYETLNYPSSQFLHSELSGTLHPLSERPQANEQNVLPLPAAETLHQFPPSLLSDPCEFNKLYLLNLTIESVGSSTAHVRWQVRKSHSRGPVLFRVLYERFGQSGRFQRFVYPRGPAESLTLQELTADTPYFVCVESIIGGRACSVAPRDQCVGLVTLPAEDEQPWLNYQMLALALLALNALLLLLGLVVWGSRAARRKWCRRRPPVHVRQMYSTRRPYRSVGTGVSTDFSGFQSHRPRTTVCALGEADLIEFPGCDRFREGVNIHREDLLQRFTD
uniref:TLR4 interactor with leucine rich repeats n=1 Tax=Leptobrachium leishanense TaxID=445787 RepID=A0A8C5MKD8_9ANUR